jgi:hypothetical protein
VPTARGAAPHQEAQKKIDPTKRVRLHSGPTYDLTYHVNSFPTHAPAERFRSIVNGVLRALWWHSRVDGPPPGPAGRLLAGPLLFLVWQRLREAAVRLTDLAARHAAGTLPKPRPPRATPPDPDPPSDPAARPARPPRHRPDPSLPGGFGWLLRHAPGLAIYRPHLIRLLADPELAALAAAAPQVARPVRSLCRMLGVRPPPGLFPKRKPRPPGPAQRAARAEAAQRREERARRRADLAALDARLFPPRWRFWPPWVRRPRHRRAGRAPPSPA